MGDSGFDKTVTLGPCMTRDGESYFQHRSMELLKGPMPYVRGTI